jgi:hypothetical protein
MESSNLGKMSSNYIEVNDIKNAFIRHDGGEWMGSSHPEKNCHPITLA